MDDPLPEEFDVIIIGTGLPESVLSGALSRINQKVLHLDANDYYGSSWASFNIKDFDNFMKHGNEPTASTNVNLETIVESGEKFFPITLRNCISQSESHCHLSKTIDACTTSSNETEGSEATENLKKDSVDKGLAAAINSETVDTTTDTAQSEVENANVESDETEIEGKSEIASPSAEDKTDGNSNQEAVLEVTLKQPDPPQLSPFDKFYEKWRHFNIDLASKMLFSRGLLVELLIQSNVSRYLEFRNVSQILTLMNRQLQPVPCTRADVFKSKFVSVVQKRILMRILTTCASYEQHPEIERDYAAKPFVEFLEANKLCKEAQHFIIHSIAMVGENVPTMEGVRATQRFLQSLGRYGNSAFLVPSYGVGELPQAFSRLSAVFGGTFCLRRHAAGLIVDAQTNQCIGIIDSTGQKIRCKHVIVDESNVPECAQREYQSAISRAVYVTDRSLQPASTEHVSLITLPATDVYPSIRMIEEGPATSVCPAKHHLVHAMTNASSTTAVQSPKTLFQAVENILFASDLTAEGDVGDSTSKEASTRPNILWRAYFNLLSGGVDQDKLPGHVYIMKSVDDQLGFDAAMTEARRLFQLICADEEFLPRAPEPDEIIFNDEGYNTEKNGSSSSEGGPEEDQGEYAEHNDELLNNGEFENSSTNQDAGRSTATDASGSSANDVAEHSSIGDVTGSSTNQNPDESIS